MMEVCNAKETALDLRAAINVKRSMEDLFNPARTFAQSSFGSCIQELMDTPQYINEVISDVRCIKPGWYAMDDVGNLSSGPFSSHAECFGSIIQPAYGPLKNHS